MNLDPSDPFFTTAVARLIDERLTQSQLAVSIRQLQGLAHGVFSTWNWTTGPSTDLLIPHGMQAQPTGFVTSGFIRASEALTDARAPWMVMPLGTDATNLHVRVVTYNKASIGGFAANEPIHWAAWV